MQFFRRGPAWVLDRIELDSADGPAPINEPTGANASQMRVALAPMRAAETVRQKRSGASGDPIVLYAIDPGSKTGPYNYSAMVNYANVYWDNYNPNYKTFNEVGGDCTNFVSQIMKAGGWADEYGFYRDDNNWWYNSMNQTWTWINVTYWNAFASIRSHRTRILSGPTSMLPADVLQADFSNNGSKDHTMFVSYHSGTQPYLTYHSSDTYRRSLSSLMSAYPKARWIPHRT